ncbi:MAG: cation:proton antiporter [Pseudomonadales bacterium]|nr:cation:proton antiporter [Pseudomonadales bacterium]
MDLLVLGGLFLVGLVADVIGKATPLPRITWLLACGVAIGPYGLDLVSGRIIDEWFPQLTGVALALVGFLLGRHLSPVILRARGADMTLLALGKVCGSALVVFVVLICAGVELPLALLFAGIASATAPAATFDVVKEADVRGDFVDQLLSIVAIDDALGLILFSLLLAAATVLTGTPGLEPLWLGVLEIFGSVLLGGLLGVAMGLLSVRLASLKVNGDSTQAEAFGFLFLCAGTAAVFDLSPILSAMTMGAVVASFGKDSEKPFQSVEQAEWPFMILFFIFAGASLAVESLTLVGVIGVLYILARGIGTWLGLAVTNRLLSVEVRAPGMLSLALLAQAGVALGMALMASQRLPEYRETILSVILATTFLLELTSPVLTRWVLRRVEERGLSV